MTDVDEHRDKRVRVEESREALAREREAVLSLAEQGLLDDDLSLPPSSRDGDHDHEDDMLDGRDDGDEFDAMADLMSEMAYSGDELIQHESSPIPSSSKPAIDENAGFFMSLRVNKRIQVSEEGQQRARKLLASPTKPSSSSSAPLAPVDTVKVAPEPAKAKPKPLVKPSFSTPARAALLQSTTPRVSTFKSPMLFSAASSSKATPTQRINTQIKPRPRPPVQHSFVTPFKNGVRPSNLTPAGLPSVKATTKPKPKPKTHDPVFDLGLVNNGEGKMSRVKLNEALRPQTRPYDDLVNVLPVELLDMSLQSARRFVFASDSTAGGGGGPKEALEAIKAKGCTETTQKWVENHWSLIVWTHASVVRSRPDYSARYWSFSSVVDALLYRYEREVNLAQRSAIKRIQEHDSSAALPLVLCLSAVVRSATGDSGIVEHLEMTDGWYVVRTNVDPTLVRAIDSGKLVFGSKLAIVNARLEGNRDGLDPIEGQDRTTLVISANSCTLAPWHAKLGFVTATATANKQAFVSSLSRLTCDGGLVHAVDVIVERVYPIGYMSAATGPDGEGIRRWNAEEEREEQEAWEKGRQALHAKLFERSMTNDGNSWRDVLAYLADQLADSSTSTTWTSTTTAEVEEDADEVMDQIEDATSFAEKKKLIDAVARSSVKTLAACAKLAHERAEQAKFVTASEIAHELEQAYPRRQVRSFCVVKIVDAVASSKTSTMPATAEAQLTMWSSSSSDSSSSSSAHQAPSKVKEGKRYRMSNLIPRGRWRKGDREISLSTRHDTRIMLVD